MEIYILRHGKAQERPDTASGDAGRRLTEAGADEMRDIAAGMESLGMSPCDIISSPLARARETAAIVSERLSKRATTVPRTGVWQELRPESNVLGVHRRLAGMAHDSSIMLVGHEPNLSMLAASVIFGGGRGGAGGGRDWDPGAYLRDPPLMLKKGGVAVIRGAARGSMIRGTLRGLLTPKQLRMCGRA